MLFNSSSNCLAYNAGSDKGITSVQVFRFPLSDYNMGFTLYNTCKNQITIYKTQLNMHFTFTQSKLPIWLLAQVVLGLWWGLVAVVVGKLVLVMVKMLEPGKVCGGLVDFGTQEVSIWSTDPSLEPLLCRWRGKCLLQLKLGGRGARGAVVLGCL